MWGEQRAVLPAWLIAVIRQLSQFSLLGTVSAYLSSSREDGGFNSPLTFFVAATGIAKHYGDWRGRGVERIEGRRVRKTGLEGEKEEKKKIRRKHLIRADQFQVGAKLAPCSSCRVEV